MDGFLRALGFDSKPDYAERIPEDLKASDFNVHETFHHGFPSQPTVLEYDPILQLLAIGTETGAVLLLGKPGLERYFTHPSPVPVAKMQFIINKGLLVTLCDNGFLYLWSIQEQVPRILHTLEFVREKEKPTCISCSYKSEWMYVGSESGNIYLVHIPSFKVSGFTVYWNHVMGPSTRTNPGTVLSVLEHPMDEGKIFIAYTGGHCVLYNLKHHESSFQSSSTDSKQTPDHKYFIYDPGNNHIITSVCWVDSGRHVACSYSDGSIVVWSTKSEAKPEKIFTLHECDPTHFRPIYKMQVVQTDSEPMFMCSGGFPENSPEAPRTLTIMQCKSISMLSSSSTINDFLSLSSSPYPCDFQKPFALVVLAKNEMIIHDLTTPGYPKYPSYSLPYALDIHLPAVTHIFYSANCPEEFVAQLHSVKSKMMTTSTKAWPLNGGKWGKEVPHSATDIIVTGHTDGSVRLWHCNSVVFQPFFTIDTSRYFKMRYNESPSKSQSPTKQTSSPPKRPPPPSHPPPKSKKAVSKNASVVELDTKVVDEREEVKRTPSPATGQVVPDQQQQQQKQLESVDGGTLGGSVESSTSGTERKVISYNDKKSKKKKKGSRNSLEVTSPESVLADQENPGDKKHSPKLSAKSFRKMAKIVKVGRSVGRKSSKIDEVDGEENAFEEEREEGEEEEKKKGPLRPPPPSTSSPISPRSAISESEQQKPRKKRPPPRPATITLQQDSQKVDQPQQTSVTVTPSADTSTVTFKEFEAVESSSSPQAPRKTKRPVPQPQERSTYTTPSTSTPPHDSRHSPHRLTTRSQFSRAYSEVDDEFFVVNYIHMCMCGLWLCVANEGGKVMAFDFTTTAKEHPTGVIDINFDYDSVKKLYTPSSSSPSRMGVTSPSQHQVPSSASAWVYNDKINDSSSGYQLTQLCHCYSTVSSLPNSPRSPGMSSSGQLPGGGRGQEVAGAAEENRVPVTVNTIQYSTAMSILAIATRRGFAIVDTKNNSCVYILSSATSMLYLSDPSKFTHQMKKESKQPNVLARPSIRRHGTSIRFSETKRASSTHLGKGGGKRASSHPSLPVDELSPGSSTGAAMSALEEEGESGIADISVELESCVSSMELVQLQLDKLSPPTLTLWVGLASGYVASYMVNIIKGAAKRVELIPTRLICETKTPVVNIYFLNAWGDWQVVPYRPNRALSFGGDIDTLQNAPPSRHTKTPAASNCPRHYAIIVDELKLRSYSFPGFMKINIASMPIVEDKVILRSEYFTCYDLPCLATITSCQKLLIHTLPGLKLMISHIFSPLGDPLAMGTFRVSGNGIGLYMSSTSEIQRICIVKDDMLNFPACLPSVFTDRSDLSPSSCGKGFLGTLFSGSPTTINKEEMFGKPAHRAVGNLYKVDGQITRAYGGKEGRYGSRGREDSFELQGGGGGVDAGDRDKSVYGRKASSSSRRGQGGGGGPGLSGQMNKNLVSLDERKQRLSAIEQKTAKVADSASSYASLATQLAQKYERK